MPPRRRSRSRGGGEEEERSNPSHKIVAVDILDGLVAREYLKRTVQRGGAREAAIGSRGSLHRRSRSLASFRPRLLLSALKAAAASALLPAGYPHSVTSDYLSFQVYDSLQGLCSYVRGVCSSAAVLSGLGVGSSPSPSTSTLAAAATINAARDAVGMLAGFLLAATAAPGMDADAKKWRLAADVSNDVSLVLELVAAPLASAAAMAWFRRGREQAPGRSFSPSLRWPSSSSKHYSNGNYANKSEQRLRAVLFTLVVALAAAARALTGVAGGATRAALTAHFCRGSGSRRREEATERGDDGTERDSITKGSNAGDVAAKEGSQEAACTLVGMLLGLLLNRAAAKTPRLGALAFAALTVLHVYFNAKALRCLKLTSLNKARLELVVEEMLVAGSSGKDEERGGGQRQRKAASAAGSGGAVSVLTPADAAALEPLWPPPFLSSFFPRASNNRVVLGAPLGEVAEAAGTSVEELLLSLRGGEKGEEATSSSSSSSSSSSLPFVAAFSPKRKCSLVALRSDCSPSDEVAAYVLGLLLCGLGGAGELRTPREAERWLRRRWLGEGEREGENRRRTKPLAELLLERAGWDPIGRSGGGAALGRKSTLRYELFEGRRNKDE